MKHLYGVTTAMVTPFTKTGEVDLEKVVNLTEFLISKGVHCLYPLGTTGEMLRLSVKERKQVAETVVKQAANRVTVFIHVGAMNEEDTIELAKHAYEIGADGIGVVTPMFFGANDNELETYFIKVANSVPNDFPVYLYNIPQCSSNDLTAEVAQKVADSCKNVIGIKYSYPDYLRVNDYLNINDGNFSVLPGTDRLFLAALAMGCEGVVSGVSGVYPEPFVETYNAFKANDLEKARKMQKVAIQYCEALLNGSNMSYFKEALKLRGIDVGGMRSPQIDLTEEEVKELDDKLNSIRPKSSV
ncbi:MULTISPECIES: dihydrodipicolinate synthase family protein [Priestia]|uniref:Dihydrodipicolinate synthase family protein n=1 Tax=Priestia aryabhattai TaxID=412384 RepID=A0ABD7WYI2_PRIAR|nr:MULTISPECIES: dihydrodipicolinate synthase family protein [Priestia]MBY0076265.1 dihydrodipicolinate synthase family protein [Priestia aryabhattai]MCU7745797.1 dihydrodipicolinate synthase family protein [Priestia megaterium]MED3821141.1 dihydrodipicolinate synthase family protein [Priestia aryabhattai]MED4012667.1 dihydrodipicolinate synthase family protein [Priestia aryabhattai]NGY89929.1 dihydrodipicolinate synthase family protein [Priestia megaterium]